MWSTAFCDFGAQILMVRAHKLQLDLGKYCGSILGLVLGYIQPTMNPCGYLVVKQAENLSDSACMGNEEGSEWEAISETDWGSFQSLKERKNKRL